MSSGLSFAGSNDSGLFTLALFAGDGSVGRDGWVGVGRCKAGGEGELFGTLGGGKFALPLAREGPVGEDGESVDTEDA